MQCPNCQHENPPQAKFCMECGTKLELTCSKCGLTLLAEARFCIECGTPVGGSPQPAAESTPVPQLEDLNPQIRPLIPDALAQKYAAADAQDTRENRLITALSVDITGSTQLSASQSAESAFQLMQDCFEVLVNIVASYEGIISGFRGDALLAFFGSPIVHENDSERAILAAFDMRDAMHDKGLQIRVGIHTARMTVGEIKTQLHSEYTAYGTDIVVAKRLEETADTGQILVSSETHRFTQRAFAFENLSPLSLKGFDMPVIAHSVIRPLENPRKLRGIEGLTSRLIGREVEFASLVGAIDALANEQMGQIVTVVGEAGIGKSRLVQELREMFQSHDQLQWLEGRCISIGQPMSFWPFIDILRTELGISSQDSEEDVADKLIGHINDLFGEDAQRIIPYVGQVLSAKLPEAYQEQIRYAAPEQIRHQTLLRMQEMFIALAHRHPLVLILEDLHWADELSLDLLWVLLDVLETTPLMLVCVYRPQREHRSWQIDGIASSRHRDRCTSIRLNPLTSQQSQQMVQSLLAIESLPAETEAVILQRTEGNPFFVEEVIRSLIDQGEIFQEAGGWKAKASITQINVPDTIQSVILSRIDRLQDEVKYVLKCASVIGCVFQERLLAYLSGQQALLSDRLDELESNELVYRERILPELEYAFKHALTQETTYQGLLEQQRHLFHERVAEGIEIIYQHQVEEYYEQLAYHYSRSENQAKATEYLTKAGQKTAGRYANEEALDYFNQALDLAESDVYDEILKHRAELFLELYRGMEAADDYERLLNNAKVCGNRQVELEALLGLVRAYYTVSLDQPDFAAKFVKLQTATYDLASELNDKKSMIKALVFGVQFSSDFKYWSAQEQRTNADKALALSHEIGDEVLITASMIAMFNTSRTVEFGETLRKRLEAHHDLTRLKEVYFLLMYTHLGFGNFERCIECSDAAINLAKETGTPPVMYPTIKALAALHLGRYDMAWTSLQDEVTDEAHQFGQAFQSFGLGMYFLELAAYEKATEMFEATIRQVEYLKRDWLREIAQLRLIKSCLASKTLVQEELNGLCRDIPDTKHQFSILPGEVRSDIELYLGNPEKALHEALSASRQAEAIGRKFAHVSALELQSRIQLRLNLPTEAIVCANQALHLAEEIQYMPMVWRLRAAKAKAFDMLGDTKAASQEYNAASAIVQRLANTIHSAELQRTFLSTPLVLSIINASNHQIGKDRK